MRKRFKCLINLAGVFFCFFILSYFSLQSNAYPAASSYYDTVQKYYIGYYQRPADPGGLVYWAAMLDTAGGSQSAIIDAFANSLEASTLYGAITKDNISIVVEDFYTSLLGRVSDAAGKAYYVGQFNQGKITPAAIVKAFIDGATSGTDKLCVDNKVTAAHLFTRTIDPDLDGSNLQATYNENNVNAARNFLTLNATSVKVPTQAETTAYIKANIAIATDGINAPAGMVKIPAGSFQMGDANKESWNHELPVHTVTLSAFYLDKYKVTKALWDEVYTWATANGYTFDNAGTGTAADHPVRGISWYDAVKWLNARSEKEGRTPVYYTDSGQATVYRTGQIDVINSMAKWTSNGYHLPTEAEWEYAARGGTSTRYYTGDCISSNTQANYNGETTAYYGCPKGPFRYGTTAVGSFPANPWGLYDMAGNVEEWIWDWFEYYSSSTAATNPRGPDASGRWWGRVGRGGAWNFGADALRSASRNVITPSLGGHGVYLGFRSALSQP